MSFATLKTTTTASTAAGGTFTVPYQGQSQGDFSSSSTAMLQVYARQFTGLAVTFGASAATVTWPATAPYPLPAGEYYVQFDLVGGDPLPGDVAQIEPVEDVADSTGGAVDGSLAAVGDTSTANQAAPINDNFADLSAKVNELMAAMRIAGLLKE
ncbi:hypothetical protein DFO67_13214 [Modicisalibacter xianhensis]|uniref:Uncharacterized protein n=1 Tax=Modicisalibacter xianhensis TaxID=442341 RepID=A0A4R8FEG7_9GAMM|nr:hypothetical protein [Halomonas xianhensis]TDX21895.1 hypothetical protein DFO67_13214 [Halomonas xianhensis]